MLPKMGESIGFFVAIEDGDEKIGVYWSGTVIAHVHCETVRVADCRGDIWLVIWDFELAQYVGIPDVTWYYSCGRAIPRMHGFLQSAVIH